MSCIPFSFKILSKLLKNSQCIIKDIKYSQIKIFPNKYFMVSPTRRFLIYKANDYINFKFP